MKTQMKIVYSFALTLVLVLGGFALGSQPSQVLAQCVPGETTGNLYGVAQTEAIGPIYMSTLTWNDDPLGVGHPATSQIFSVSYSQTTGLWDGRGWSPYAGWVDFGETNAANISLQQAQFESVLNDPSGWGNWDPNIDLSPVSYSTDSGSFIGLATNGDYTVGGAGSGEDDLVGAGWIDFSTVTLDITLGDDCDENIDLILDGSNILYRDTCPIAPPTIQWTSTDVSNCETDIGLWASDGLRPTQNTSGETAGGSITTSNTPVVFRLKCIGDESGNDVYGSAIASCGDDDGPTDPTSGIVIPEFKEV